MQKPVIGVLAKRNTGDTGIARLYTNLPYLESIQQAGGMPLMLPVMQADREEIAAWLRLVDGILLPGGYDVAPAYYGQHPLRQVTLTNRTEDAAEILLVQMAKAQHVPVLGVCRGLQVMNVALGGTLWQDIPTQCADSICHYQHSELRDELFHTVAVRGGSLLEEILGAQQVDTNTFHHQSVRDIAPGLVAVAQTQDGVIEALESENGLMLGVQWHPEGLSAKHKQHADLFRWLVKMSAHKNIR